MSNLPNWPDGMDATAYLRSLDRVVVLEAAADLRRYLAFCSDPVKKALVFSLVDALETNQLARWPADAGLAARGGRAPADLLAVRRRDVLLRKAAATDRYRDLTANAAAVTLAGDLAEFERGPFRQYRADCRLPAGDPEACFHQLLVGRIDGMWDLPERRQLADVLRGG